MTSKLEALRALHDAVKAGEWADKSDVQNFWRHCEVAIIDDARALWIDAWNAYNGSLDAAHALHKAVLPGWGWSVQDCGSPWALVVRIDTAHDERGDTPARAWLLAILSALIAQEEAA
jgi:hypothetical protein